MPKNDITFICFFFLGLSVSNISKKTNFLRNFNKPISQNLENANLQIDVKSINVRQVQLNFSRIKDQEDSTSKILSADMQVRKGNKKSLDIPTTKVLSSDMVQINYIRSF